MEKDLETDWTLEIKPTNSWFDIGLRDVWQYRDLLWLFVKRDIITIYQQTVLGVFWFFIPPILTTITYILIFSGVAKIPTNGAPPALFYMSGIVIWGYFTECFNRTSCTFLANASIFGKVYFPRLVAPLSTVISSLFKFEAQFLLFLALFLSFGLQNGGSFYLDFSVLLIPYLVFIMAIIVRWTGMIFLALTTKFHDFSILIGFGMQLLMCATPVIYPKSFIPEQFRPSKILNTLCSIAESFRFKFIHSGTFSLSRLMHSSVFSFASFFIGNLVFLKVGRSFMKTI